MKEGWTIKPLGEVGTFQRGGNFLKSDFVDSGFPCIHYGQIHMKFGTATYQHLSCIPADLAHKKAKIAKKGDLIIAITSEDVEGSCKCTAWMGDYDIAIGAHAAIFNHTLNPLYVSYYFKSQYFSKEKANYTHGFKVVEIRPSDIAKIPIPYPSLSEQQRIVGILNAEFEKIDALKANAEKNLQNAKDLFQAALKKELEPKEGWITSTLQQMLKLTSGDNLTTKAIKPGPYPVYGGNGIMGYHNDYNLDGQNVIVGRVGALCGNVKLIDGKIWYTDNAFLVNDKSGMFYLPFLAYILTNANLRQYATQAAQPVISNVSMKDVVLSVPQTDQEQHAIVSKLDATKSNCDALQDNYTQTITLCDDLKQALLRKAFSGEL